MNSLHASANTAYIQFEKELKVNEKKLRNVFNGSLHAIAITDLLGIIVDCNTAALKMFHYHAKEDAIGRNCFDFVSMKDLERASEDWAELMKTGMVTNIEYELITSDGRRFPALVSASLISNDSNEPSGFVLNIEDLS